MLQSFYKYFILMHENFKKILIMLANVTPKRSSFQLFPVVLDIQNLI